MAQHGPGLLELAAGHSTGSGPVPAFVGGRWEHAADGATFTTVEPATGRPLAEVAAAGAADLDRAVDRGLVAARAWGATTPTERGSIVGQVGQRLLAHADDFALLDARDNGSPLTAMRADAVKGAMALGRNAGLGVELQGRTIPATVGRLHYTALEPWGVVGRIIAFNHPTLFAAARLAPALMAGNGVVLKPSELAPLGALALAELTADLLPDGLVSVLSGGPALGEAIARHPELRRLSFTGSVATGLAVQAEAARSGVIKTVTLELGGKNPIIVLPDANLDLAARAVVDGMNFSRVQGQSCGSTSRLLVHADVRGALLDRVLDHIADIRIGDPTDPATDMGALIDAGSVDRCQRFVDDAVARGAKVLTGGSRPAAPELAGGAFYLPTVLDDVPVEADAATQEIFGPVLSVFPWTDEDACLRQANAVRYGLTASLWTADLSTAFRLVRQIDAGYLWVNDVEVRFGGVPFGGWKDSGTGLEDGLDEILAFTRTKVVNVRFDR